MDLCLIYQISDSQKAFTTEFCDELISEHNRYFPKQPKRFKYD